MKTNPRHRELKVIAQSRFHFRQTITANPDALPQGNLTAHLESELSRAALTTPTKTMKITTSSYLWRNYSIFVNPFDGIFHAIATTPTGKLQRVAASPDRAISAIQMDLLWTTIFHRESPGRLCNSPPIDAFTRMPPRTERLFPPVGAKPIAISTFWPYSGKGSTRGMRVCSERKAQ